MLCKVKDKEIYNLKRNIADFERNTEHLNYDLKICNERITDLEDRLNKEKKLRKFIKTNLEELKEQEQRRPGCRPALVVSAHRVRILNFRAMNLNHRQETILHYLTQKLDGTTLTDPRRKAQVCQYPNSMSRSRRMMKEIHAALLIKDNLWEEKTPQN